MVPDSVSKCVTLGWSRCLVWRDRNLCRPSSSIVSVPAGWLETGVRSHQTLISSHHWTAVSGCIVYTFFHISHCSALVLLFPQHKCTTQSTLLLKLTCYNVSKSSTCQYWVRPISATQCGGAGAMLVWIIHVRIQMCMNHLTCQCCGASLTIWALKEEKTLNWLDIK